MKAKKRSSRKTGHNIDSAGTTRRTFLKQSFAFAALTSTYSVVSLTQLACNNGSTSINGGYLIGTYMGDHYFEGDYFEGGYFDNFFYY